VTEFNELFQSGFQAVIEAVVDSAASWKPRPGLDQELVDFLDKLTRPFLLLWVEHSQTLRLSTLETLAAMRTGMLSALLSSAMATTSSTPSS